jgi:hypothetical protein
MDTRTVLHIGAVADGDGSHITTHDGIEPYRTLISQRDISHDGSVLAEVAVFAPLGRHTFITLN